MDTLVSRENKGEKTHLFLSTEGNVAKKCSFCSLMWCVACLCWEQEAMRAECVGLNGTRAVMWGCRGNWRIAWNVRRKERHLIFCLLCMKLIFVWSFQGTQKPGICNLVSLLYSCLWLSVCGVWIINRRARKTPSVVCCGLWLTPPGWPARSRLWSTAGARRCNRLSPGKELQECFHLQDSLLCATECL